MSHILSRISLPDYALVGGCLGLLALMVVVGAGSANGGEPEPGRPGSTHQGSEFWSSWPGALVASFGGGALLYLILALYAATGRA